MFYRAIHFSMFVLMVWLVSQLNHVNARISALSSMTNIAYEDTEKSLLLVRQENKEHLGDLLKQMNSQLEAKYNLTSKKQLDLLKVKQEQIVTLHQAYIAVLEAEIARGFGDNKTALAKLQKGKKLVWKSGANYPKQKEQLHGLMKPIDITLRGWENNDLSKSTQAITPVIRAVLKEQGK